MYEAIPFHVPLYIHPHNVHPNLTPHPTPYPVPSTAMLKATPVPSGDWRAYMAQNGLKDASDDWAAAVVAASAASAGSAAAAAAATM